MMDAGWPVAAFGVPAEAIWGVLIGGPAPRLAVARLASDGAPAAFEPASIELQPGGTGWTVVSERASLHLNGDQPAPYELTPCEVAGELLANGDAVPLTAHGVRCAELRSRKIGSVRLVASWLTAGHGAALLAARPERASGQDRDEITVAVYGEASGMSVFDARLSTTYDRGGTPRRMGIELWLGESEEGDQYPRRVAGTAVGPPLTERLGSIEMTVAPMHCQSRGDDGIGAYVLLGTA
jgi:hypothetical protein